MEINGKPIDMECFYDKIRERFRFINSTPLFIGKTESLFDENTLFSQLQTDFKKIITIGEITINKAPFLYLLIFDKKVIMIDKNDFRQLNLKNPILCSEDMTITNDDKKPVTLEDNKSLIETNLFKPIKNLFVNIIIERNRKRETMTQPKKQLKQNFICLFIIRKSIELCFNIEDQFLYVLKPFYLEDPDQEASFYHEIEFYKKCGNNCPYICKFYGVIRDNNTCYLVLEYIEGRKLSSYFDNSNNELSKEEKIKIIIQIMVSIEFLHLNNFIYRDLKDDNIIIDINKNAILFDFDSSTIENAGLKTENIGNDFFVSPEQYSSRDYSFKTDIYSLGVLIYCIIKNENAQYLNDDLKTIPIKLDCPLEYEKYTYEFKSCLNIKPKERPNISFILNRFSDVYSKNATEEDKKICKEIFEIREKMFNSTFSIKKLNEKSEEIKKQSQYLFDCIGDITYFFGCSYYGYNKIIDMNLENTKYYILLSSKYENSWALLRYGAALYQGYIIQKDINKAIECFKLSLKKNNTFAEYRLAIIHLESQQKKDIDIAISLLTKSSNENNQNAQFLLGKIYFEGRYVEQDIEKGIDLLMKSSKNIHQNSDALCFLGQIYYEGIYVDQDMKKAYNFLKSASDKNNSFAQYYLGKMIYKEFGQQYIDIAIKYLTLSSKHYNSDALFLLGNLYNDGKYVKKNIKKAIYYFRQSSSFYNQYAKNNLGVIYKNGGDGVDKNISYSIIFFNEAIKIEDDPYSKYNLARIYYFGINIKRDISLSIKLLESLSKGESEKSYLFLYYIYKYGDKSVINPNKAENYLNQYYSEVFKSLEGINIEERLSIFLKEYDLIYSDNDCNFKFIFESYMLTGEYKTQESKSNHNEHNVQNITKDFYDGFGVKKYGCTWALNFSQW